MTMQKTKEKQTEKTANGNTAPVAETAPAPADSAEPKKAKPRGAIPTMPIACIYFRPDGKCVAAVISPKGGRFEAVGRGTGSAKGELEDMGFVLSSLHNDPPAWVEAQGVIPSDAKVVGFAYISGFPLPKQD